MNTLHKVFHTNRLVAMVAALLILTTLSCQKDRDYSRPPDNKNSFDGDKIAAFKNLTDDQDVVWAWDMPVSIVGNKFPSLLLQFSKDSTANIYSIVANGISADLTSLYFSGTLTTDEADLAAGLVDAFAGLSDADLREILDDPRNLDYKNWVLELLPNYENFNSLGFYQEERGGKFDFNGPVQVSLTFHNSKLLANLKQNRLLDFDFRVLSYTKDTVRLDGYFANSANKSSVLLKTKAQPGLFAAGSSIIIAINPVKANVKFVVGGVTVGVPAGYNTCLDFFYKAFNQGFDAKTGYGFLPNGKGTAVAPDVLKTAKMVTVKKAFSGDPVAAPAGTVLVTLSVINTDGTTKDIDVVKN